MAGKLNLFLDLGALSCSASEVVELCTAHLTATDNVNLLNIRRVYGEGLLYADTVGYSSYGEGLGNSASLDGDDSSFEHLNTLFVSFLDSVVNSYGITDVELGHFRFELLVC